FLGAVEASLSRLGSSRAAFDEAWSKSRGETERVAIALNRVVLDLELARREPDQRRARELRSTARAALREASEANVSGAVEVRLSRRIAEWAFVRDDAASSSPASIEPEVEANEGKLVVHASGKWFRVPGKKTVDCSLRHAPIRSILVALAHH